MRAQVTLHATDEAARDMLSGLLSRSNGELLVRFASVCDEHGMAVIAVSMPGWAAPEEAESVRCGGFLALMLAADAAMVSTAHMPSVPSGG